MQGRTGDHFIYRADIDGLRAVAVLSVLAYHGFPALLPGGFVGVDVFFVISGFLISGIILTSLRNGTFTFADFYARRIRRIFPALIVVLTASLIAGWFILFPVDFAKLAMHAAAGAGFVANIALWRESGYFDTASELKPLLHLWSLGVEEQYYLVWPVLLILANRFLHRLLGVVLVIAGVSFALNIAAVDAYRSAAFYLPVTRFWELMLGSALAYLHVFHPRAVAALHADGEGRALVRNAAACVGVVLLALAFTLTRESYAFPGWWALLPTLGTTLLIGAGPSAAINRRLLSANYLVYVGLISYPLYLWHWPLLTFARIVEDGIPPASVRVAALLASFVLADLTYRFVERPIRKRVSIGPRRFAVPGLSAAMTAVAGCALLVVVGRVSSASASIPHVADVSAAISDWDFGGNGTMRGDSERAVLFFGDSHMQQYWPRIAKLTEERRAPIRTVVFHAEGGCAPVPGIERRGARCQPFVDSGFARAAQADIETVVIAASWPGFASRSDYFSAGPNPKGPVNVLAPESAWVLQGFERALAELRDKGKNVVLVLSSPRGDPLDPKVMLQRRGLVGWEVELSEPIPRSAVDAERSPIDDRLRDIAARVGAVTVDPVDSLCSKDECPALDDEERPLFKDLSHIRASVVRERFSALDRFVYLAGARAGDANHSARAESSP